MSGTNTVQLRDLLTMLRAEVGHSTNVAHGVNDRETLVYLLNRTQDELYEQYNWPSLNVDRDIPIAVGQRYYPYDPDLPFEAIEKAWLVWQTLYTEIYYNIRPEEFMLWNSDKGFTSWPVQRWRHHPDDNTFELWPIPSEAPVSMGVPASVRFRGPKFVRMMIQDSDYTTLPYRPILLFAAGEVLAREKAADAQLKMQKGQEWLRRMKVKQGAQKTKPFVVGGGSDGTGYQPRVGLDYIPPGYGYGPVRP
jgi:hypothetical protein